MSRLEKRIGRTQDKKEEEPDGEPNDCRVRMLESMKRMQKNDKYLDEKIKMLLSDLDITISGHKFALLLDFKRRDLAFGYSTSIKEKKRNVRLHGRKLSIEDANEIFEFFKELATAKRGVIK
ncbi:MAG: hypothetical protein ACYDEF_09370 [Methanosarcina sp.]